MDVKSVQALAGSGIQKVGDPHLGRMWSSDCSLHHTVPAQLQLAPLGASSLCLHCVFGRWHQGPGLDAPMSSAGMGSPELFPSHMSPTVRTGVLDFGMAVLEQLLDPGKASWCLQSWAASGSCSTGSSVPSSSCHTSLQPFLQSCSQSAQRHPHPLLHIQPQSPRIPQSSPAWALLLHPHIGLIPPSCCS